MSNHEEGIPAVRPMLMMLRIQTTMSWNGSHPVTPTVWLRPNLEARQRQSWTCRRPSPVTSLPVPSGQAWPARSCLRIFYPYSLDPALPPLTIPSLSGADLALRHLPQYNQNSFPVASKPLVITEPRLRLRIHTLPSALQILTELIQVWVEIPPPLAPSGSTNTPFLSSRVQRVNKDTSRNSDNK
ncbi:hypothetical protein Landi51_07267 [Colletotrichum acutatum]